MNRLRYPKAEAAWNEDDFRNPNAEYRGAPLWCWNTKLNRGRLLRQIEHLVDMGMGGFHIHSRVGLDTPYMGEEFMGHVKACAESAKAKGLLACLYDDDRWPSGAAGGLVVADNPEYKALHLLLTKREYGSFTLPPPLQGANGQARRSELGSLSARYNLEHNDQGLIASFTRLKDDATSDHRTWFAYLEPNPPSEWFNGNTYVDTLNPKAIQKFIEKTHEKYYDLLGSEFGDTVPSIFTDEPQFAHKSRPISPSGEEDLFLPWTSNFATTFQEQHGYDIWDELPRVLWDIPAEGSPEASQRPEEARIFPGSARYHFHDHVCERFVDAFMDTIAAWCRDRRIALIGHMMNEPTLLSQTKALGEAMRCYRNLDMPGVDMLCDAYEYNTAKQATSVARQNGSRGVMSEIYGVTNWTFDFAGHKGAGDWQAALGITFRVHHLTWVSMAGEAKRDYPACIGYQSPWYKEYKNIEDHFARVNVALTRGKPVVRVGVIHLIESFWLCYGPMDTNAAECKFREDMFSSLTSWLLHGLIDFDFISESMLPQQTTLSSIQHGQPFLVGHAQYEVLIVPGLKTVRSTTLDRLRRFAEVGGVVLIAGDEPTVLDGATSLDLLQPVDPFHRVALNEHSLLSSLEDYRDVRIKGEEHGEVVTSMLYQLRKDEDNLFLFICNTHRKRFFVTDIGIRGSWTPTILDTLTGERHVAEVSERSNGWTWLKWHFEACASLLLELSPFTGNSLETALPQAIYRDGWVTVSRPSIDAVELSEPNVLLLDYASFTFGERPWQPETEILRIDNIVREELGLPLKGEAYRQPWAVAAEARAPKTVLRLRYDVVSETKVPGVQIAAEIQDGTTITFEGHDIPVQRTGWWVDEDISLIDVPHAITPGKHVLEVCIPFGLLTNLERFYLLGQFSVRVRGKSCFLESLDTSSIDFGDWTRQGLPFYSGNVTYVCRSVVNTAVSERTIVHVPHFAGPVLAVYLDGKRKGMIALQPNIVDLGVLEPGQKYELRIVCYGNRENAFDTVHMPDGVRRWLAPNAWRTEHDWWIEGYNVKPMGVLDNPKLKIEGKETWKVRAIRRGFGLVRESITN